MERLGVSKVFFCVNIRVGYVGEGQGPRFRQIHASDWHWIYETKQQGGNVQKRFHISKYCSQMEGLGCAVAPLPGEEAAFEEGFFKTQGGGMAEEASHLNATIHHLVACLKGIGVSLDKSKQRGIHL